MGRPESIRAFFARARRRESLGRAARTLSVAASSAVVVAAAVELDGGDALRGGALLVSAACAAAGAVLAWRETGVDDVHFARALDRRLGQRGALSTAFEAERASNSTFGALLGVRAAEALPDDALARGAPSPSLAWLAAPLFALGAWLLASQARAPRHVDLADLASRVESALAGGDSESSSAAARGTAQEVERRASDARASDAELLACVQRLSNELSSVLADPSLPVDSRLEIAATRAELERAASRLAVGQKGPSAEDGSSRQGPNDRSNASTTLQNVAADRTMKGSPSDATPSDYDPDAPDADAPDADASRNAAGAGRASPDDASPAASEVGVAAGRWWPREHDDVVAAWRGRSR